MLNETFSVNFKHCALHQKQSIIHLILEHKLAMYQISHLSSLSQEVIHYLLSAEFSAGIMTSSMLFRILTTFLGSKLEIHNRAHTLFENYWKCRIWMYEFWHFSLIFIQLKLTCLVTLFDRKLQVFKNSSKWTICWRF